MFYSSVCVAVRLLLRLISRTRVEGAERIPTSGPVLFVSNHLNLIDPPVLGALLPRRITFMAKEELFRTPVVGWVVKWYGAFSVRRGQADRQALRTATEVLRRGGALGMFPEGTRSKTGAMNQAHAGAAMIALATGAVVVPVAIAGTDRVRTPLSFLTRPRITITVGEPFVLKREGGRKDGLEEATRTMMGRIAALLPAEKRGFYADAAGQN